MWNIVSGNRVIDRRRKSQAHRRHLDALLKAKPQINNLAPR
jgi:hypothetical protein